MTHYDAWTPGIRDDGGKPKGHRVPPALTQVCIQIRSVRST